MSDFKSAYDFAMKWEGGYANVEGDKGGETYRGIARNANPNWQGWPLIDAIKKTRAIKHNEYLPDVDEVHFPYAQEKYWDRFHLGEIRSQQVANIIFDFVWGSGYTGLKLALKVLSVMTGKKFEKWGVVAVDAINTLPAPKYVENLLRVRKDFLNAIVTKNPSQKKFLKGWLNRLNDLAASVGTFIKEHKAGFGGVGLLAVALIAYAISKR